MQATNDTNPEPGTTAGSHLKQERNALESRTSDARDQAKQKAHQAYDEVREGTRKIARESGSYLKKVMAEQQHLLVEKLEEYRDAANAASDKLESDDDTLASKNIRKAAGGLNSVANYVRDCNPNDFMSDASRMARKRPELVFGVLFLAGLGIARVLKASARKRQRDENSSNGGPSTVAGGNGNFAASEPIHRPAPTSAAFPAAPGLHDGRMNINPATL